MHFPVYLKLGPWRVHPHFVFETAAYTIGFQVYRLLRKRQGDVVSRDARWSVIAAAAVGAALGSKMLGWFDDPHLLLQAWRQPAFLLGSKTLVGGLIGGLLAVEITKHFLRIQRRTGDLFAAPIAIGIAIGRIGCFLTGLEDKTYGLPTTLPWGVNFGDGVARHPVQLYEAIFALLLASALWCFSLRSHAEGDVFKLFMVAYMTWRFLIDFLKPGVAIAGLTAIQWACLGCIVYYTRDIARWLRPHPHARTAEVAH